MASCWPASRTRFRSSRHTIRPVLEISVQDLKEKLDAGERVHLLDVRQPEEVAVVALDGAEQIPMMDLFLGLRKTEAASDAEIVAFCHVGLRSLEAARFLRQQGFERACSLAGGIDAWSRLIEPDLPRY